VKSALEPLRRLWLVSLIALLACSGCSVSLFVRSDDPPKPLPTPSTAPGSSGPNHTHVQRATDTVTGGPAAQAFHTGLQSFCHAWYLGERRDELRSLHYTGGVPAMDGGLYYQARVQTTRRIDTRLAALRPPTDLASAFSSFERNERAVYRAERGQRGAGLSPTPADLAFDHGLDRRHALAVELHASNCDGLLPQDQQRAVVAVSRRFDLSTSPRIGCRALVLPQFLSTAFTGGYTSCAERLMTLRAQSWKLPHAIRVQSVTGVEGVQATVHFYEVGCACTGDTRLVTVVLYDIGGRWRVRWVD
jgi:hypothetical protein